MQIKETYGILRLKEGANLEEVKAAYRGLAFALHPDLNQDNPHAARQFQRVNEAYVLLKRHLESSVNAKFETRRDNGSAQPGPAREAAKPKTGPRPRPKKRPGPERKARPASSSGKSFKAAKDEVLGDILKDPFARQVFKDIYRQIRKKSGNKSLARSKRAPRKKKMRLEWGDKKLDIDLSQGLWNGAKSWFRSWMDDEQEIRIPLASLRPGSRIRLQVRQGWTGKTISVEVTLPPDYVIGRAVRLKGLGRRIGPIKGDLYVKLLAG